LEKHLDIARPVFASRETKKNEKEKKRSSRSPTCSPISGLEVSSGKGKKKSKQWT